MFTLRIHSVDTGHPLFQTAGRPTANSTITKPNPTIEERRGIVHLFRKISPNPNAQCTTTLLLFVVAVPAHLSSDDFLRFCGSYIDHVAEIVIIRNDAMEDRYSVLIKVVDQKWANSFHRNFSGRPFSSTEAEVCHILFTESVEYTEVIEFSGAPPLGFTELPTCPVCLERLDQDTSGILTTLCDHSFQCPCNSKWTDSSCLVCRLCQQQAERPTCSICGTSENLWICVICGFIGCGRYKERHAIQHWKDTQHCYSLDLETQQIWDYVGDTYVHRLNQSRVDGKLVDSTSPCRSLNEDCRNCTCNEESGISMTVLDSKVEAIMDEYNHLLASQLENQRQYYEKLLSEAKGKKEKAAAEALERADSKLQEIQLKIEKCDEEKKVIANMNANLMKNQEIWLKRLKEMEERERASIREREEKILDLEEQIRDIRIYVETQRRIDKISDMDSIRGGTILPVPLHQSLSGDSKRRTKSNRRRK